MIEKVIKRDGTVVDFDPSKIVNAVLKASEEVPVNYQVPVSDAKAIANEINSKFAGEVSVERIQDEVEYLLMSNGFFNVSKAYMLYREKRSMVRKSNTTDEQILSLIECNNEEVKQ